MLLGIISDIHGNVFALKECVRHLYAFGLDEVLFLGDAVGYMPGEEGVIAILEGLGATCQQGNHEAMMLDTNDNDLKAEEIYRLKTAKARIGFDRVAWIGNWPSYREKKVLGRHLLFVHGSPENALEGYRYADFDWSVYQKSPYDAIFMGHTHRPFIVELDRRLFINVGSVGLPRDQGNLGSFAIYDVNKHQCRILRFTFDTQAVIGAYGKEMHFSVLECLKRKSANVMGEQLDG